MRAALYARFSTDAQNHASAADQLERCRRYAEGRGFEVRERFSDEGLSGASLDRPGLTALRAAVEAGRVDVVIAESLDRISRTTSEAMGLIERFSWRGVGVIGIADGVDTSQRGGMLMAGIRSALGAEYLRDLSDKTRRGMAGRARAGLSTGCPPFGYRSVQLATGGFRYEIHPERAAVVRRIFADHAAGRPVLEIARALNAEGIEPPRARPDRRGTGWVPSSVRAILVNERYTGRWTFGLRRWEKEPGTNRRKVRPGPAPEVTDRPELAIVDAKTWAVVSSRFTKEAVPRRRVHHLLSGLLRCGRCRTVMTIHASGRYYGCAAARAGGACDSRASLRVDLVRPLVVDGVRELLERHAGKLAARIAKRLAAEQATDQREAIAARIESCERKIARLVAAVADGRGPASVLAAIRDLESQAAGHREQLAALSAAMGEQAVTVDTVLAEVRDVAAALDGDPQLGRERLRRLLDDGAIYATPEDGGWRVRGGLIVDALLGTATPAPGQARAGVPTKVVAGAGYDGCRGVAGRVVPFRWHARAA